MTEFHRKPINRVYKMIKVLKKYQENKKSKNSKTTAQCRPTRVRKVMLWRATDNLPKKTYE
jgi:hypothetical protein